MEGFSTLPIRDAEHREYQAPLSETIQGRKLAEQLKTTGPFPQPLRTPGPFASDMRAQPASLAGAAVLPIIGAVVGGLKEILPFISGGGKKKKVAAGVVRAGESALRRMAADSVQKPSMVDAVAEQFRNLAEEDLTPAMMRAYGLALQMAGESDKRVLQGLAEQVLIVSADLDTAMDVLVGEDDDKE